jgi:hypothetical protein
MKQKLLTLTFALLLLSGYAQNQNALNNLVPFGGGTECLTWVDPSPTTGYTNFNTTFGGAPCNDGTGCPFNEIQGFEVWQSEAYAMANVVAGGSYTFSMCNGPGAGTWIPDFTIIGPGGIVDASGTGDGDGCSITWTASQSGAYIIVINELGNCGVAGAVDNGFPAITCNGTPDCEAPGECSAGEIANTEPQFICPGDEAIFETDGTENIPLLPGGYAIVFTPTTGTGGIDDVLTLFGVTLPYTFDNDLNGLLSANALPVFEGEWSISGFAYTDEEDLEGTLCSETSESFLVTFLDSSDPLCDVVPGDCSAGEIANTEPQFVCPGDDAIFETDGTEEIPALPGGYAIVFTPTTGTGGIDDVLTLFGVTPPYNFDNDLNGVLSANALPPFAGEWSISGFAYTDEDDLEGSLCSETSESFLVTFLASNDPLCGGTCPDGEIEDCNGNCAPEEWVGDGSCDDGSFTYNGFAIFFNCEEFDNDGGDCDINDDCTSWVEPSPTTGWSDFNNDPLSGAPVPDNGVCPFIEITDFQVWQSEAYAMDNVTAETCYTFSHCNGDAGTWIPYYAIIAPSGAVDYEGLGDGDGCSVTWIASETGTYFIVINEDGNCGVAGTDDNGFPAITCNADACLTVSVDETAASTFNIFPNPNNGQFMINYVGESGLASIEVMDVAGKVIISNQQAVTSGTRVDMNVGNVRGLYFVRITMNNQQQVHKVVVN